MFCLPQGANIQRKSSKETDPIQKFDKKKAFQTPMMKIPTKSTKFSKTESRDPNQVAKWVAKIFTSCKWVMKASGWTCDLHCMIGKLWDESLKFSQVASELRKTLIPIFQHRTYLNNEKQSKH